MYDNDITVYMHGGNIMSGHFGYATDAEFLELMVYPHHEEAASYQYASYSIAWTHVERIEFTGKRRAKFGMEFVGLEY